jgi:RNA polymerase sigma-70 factor (ECF subfamily)
MPEPPGKHDAAPIAYSADGLLVDRLRRGDADAGYHFFRDHYPSIYRYLFWLTERPDRAEDLAQETFLRAWRHLDRFDPRGSLRAWLHAIAHREFLRSLRRETPAQLSVVGEVGAPEAATFTEAVMLRQIVRELPLEEREVVLLHDLEGYSSGEIGAIVGAPASTVRRRLAHARERLRQALGEDDLRYLNESFGPMRHWAWLPLEQMRALETCLATPTRSVAPDDKATEDASMERRRLLRQTAAAVAGLALAGADKEIIDSRLPQKVTLAVKGTALSDLCEQLRAETGVSLTAGSSVADEKVTVFCKQLPLRDVMRQLSRPFGYAWLRSERAGAYRYELVQDLRSQLLEEELRNRDRNAALIALEEEIDRYRRYRDLSPDEALARSRSAPPVEKRLLEKLATQGWGPIQVYFRLSPQELTALRAGQTLTFSQEPSPGEKPLSTEIARGVLQAYRDLRFRVNGDGMRIGSEKEVPDGLPPSSIPEARAIVTLTLKQSELGWFALDGESGVAIAPGMGGTINGNGPYAIGRNPAALQPNNRAANARLAGAAAMRAPLSFQPRPSCRPIPVAGPTPGTSEAGEIKVTSADVLEAVHQASGLPIVADYYTRLYRIASVSVKQQPLFDALNQITDAMRFRWTKEGEWLQFRSASYYDDRLKEVPNRLLTRWAASRKERGALSLDEVIEIAQLSDAQLDAVEMAEGVKECFGILEWEVARKKQLRPHVRCLALLQPAQRERARRAAGLPFTDLTVAQQQAFASGPLAGYLRIMKTASLADLAGMSLYVGYSQPTGFAVQIPSAPWKRPLGLLLVHERSAAAALQAAHRIDPRVEGSEIVPAALAVTVTYGWGEPPASGGLVFTRATSAGFRDLFGSFP